jgi:hypothetical protein
MRGDFGMVDGEVVVQEDGRFMTVGDEIFGLEIAGYLEVCLCLVVYIFKQL